MGLLMQALKGTLVADFADITTAIHVIQENMGIAGATAAEAEGTISGSVASMKAAWENLVTGIANPTADIGSLLDEFMASVETTVGNIVPVVKRILGSIGETIEERGPDMIADGALLLAKLALGLVMAIPDIVSKIPEITKAVGEAFKERGDEFKDIGKNIVSGVWEGIKSLYNWIKEKVSGFFGGIVSGVKDLLGIHSPSRVFAEMGSFMAEGLGEGWDKQYRKVKGDIEGGLHFGAGSVDFAASAVGVSSAGIINGFASANKQEGNAFEVVLKLPDNTELARYYLPSFINVARANGTPIVNPL